MPNPYLLLWLEAPLQSWGAGSKFGRRDTLPFPTKSGVLGLICAALGAGGKQKAFLNEFVPLDQTVISFVRRHETGSTALKQDREVLLRDFHMVGAGYNANDPWQALLEPYKSDGKPRKSDGGGAKMTYRYYLQDAAFAVALEVPSDKTELIANALQNPAWDIYLGRKSCAPSDFIFHGVYDTKTGALEQANLIARQKGRSEDFRVLDGASVGGDADEVFTINDVPLQFGENKRYSDRLVTLISAR